ncbi:MAG: M20 family metallo-hydrolase [Candidatus Parcubacteria bacterium]|nr:M20 family metallo-hydrolase [Burkholderiales bacterium]
MSDTDKAAKSVSEARLWQRHVEMGAIGGTARGGVCRLALTTEDAAAQRALETWAKVRGYAVTRDEIGNVYVRRDGTDPAAAPVVTGSHLDSQPTGGKYDGAYGVLAGFEVLEALDDAKLATHRPVEVVAWMNEEGSRFSPGAMGSGVVAGAFSLDSALAKIDAEGISVAAALAEVRRLTPLAVRSVKEVKPFAYIEVHIEQGPKLEAEGATIGVVTGIQGIRRFAVDITGEEAHAGTTPRANRRDAMVAAVALISALQAAANDPEDTIRYTVGRLQVWPNSPNTVPGRVHFTIDLRHPDEDLLQSFATRIHELAQKIAREKNCGAAVQDVSAVKPVKFPLEMVELVRTATEAEGAKHLSFPSGAGHDAMYLDRMCPTGMVFVPCLRGVSHNEAESATAADLAVGTRVLARAIVEIAARR